MRAGACAALACAALAATGCGKPAKKLGRRARDAGPPVVLMERAPDGTPIEDEKEPNDKAEAAQRLGLPGGVRGVIGAGGDADGYTLSVAASGTLTVRLSGAGDADLTLEIVDAAGKRVVMSDNGPAGALEGVPNLGVSPGAYRLVVREFVKKKGKTAPPARARPSAPYLLTVALGPVPTAGEEAEPNDAAGFAAEVPVGGSGAGYAGWRKDRDVWKVKLDAVGDDDALALDVDGVPGVALRVGVLDGTEAPLLTHQGRPGESVALRNIAVRPGEPHYYVELTADRGNVEEKYTLRVVAAPFQLDEEAEPNNSIAAASPLADVAGVDSGTRVGFLVAGDVDVYELEAAETARLLSVTLEPPAGVGPGLAVLDAKGKPIGTPVDAKRGVAARLENVAIPAGAPAFVRAAAKLGGSDTDRYRLRWSTVPSDQVPILGVDE